MPTLCDNQVQHMSKVKIKVIKNIKTTAWDITFEPEVVETSGWLQDVYNEHTYQYALTYYVPFLRHVTSNKT